MQYEIICSRCRRCRGNRQFTSAMHVHVSGYFVHTGTYVAGMEGHTSAWYVSEWLRIVSEHSTTGGDPLSPTVEAAISLATQYVQHAGGVMRSLYPSGMPAAALSKWAYQVCVCYNLSTAAPCCCTMKIQRFYDQVSTTNSLTRTLIVGAVCLGVVMHGRAVTRPPQTGAPNNGSVEIPVEDYRFDRSQPGIVGQEVYGSGACFDMAMLERRHGARASVRADAAAAAPGEWRPGQYLWPRAISGRRGEAVIITVFYPHDKLVSELGGATAAIKTPPVIQAATTISPFKIKRVERRKDEHLDLWVFIGGSAALGTHETIVSAAPLPFLIHW